GAPADVTLRQLTAADDLPAGMSVGDWVIESTGSSLPSSVTLTYTPHPDAEHVNGTLTVDAQIRHRETGAPADDWETASALNSTVQLEKINNGYEFLDGSGNPLAAGAVIVASGD